jgi:ferric-dicitrate binding protein FerR (iron transport regulator)
MLVARRSVLIGLGLIGLGPDLAAAAIEAVKVGNVLAVTGATTGQIGGTKRPLVLGAPVFIDDTLATGDAARLSAHLGTATKLSLGERTRIKINQFLVDSGGALTLGRGAMLFDRPDDPASGPLEVMTPFGLIAARGTKFFAGPSEGVFGVYVAHGLVTVRTRVGAVHVTVGLGTHIASIRAAPTKPKVWAPSLVAAALALVVS